MISLRKTSPFDTIVCSPPEKNRTQIGAREPVLWWHAIAEALGWSMTGRQIWYSRQPQITWRDDGCLAPHGWIINGALQTWSD
jgi:hypothetical protein